MPVLPELLGGSADLTPSNGTRTKHHTSIAPGNFAANYMHYGVREHAMAAAMNGIALSRIVHSLWRDVPGVHRLLPAVDPLSALMEQRVIYVMTHDSIGVGEDGPTHQPVEHVAALRAMPNVQVFRPADALETAECWEIALASTKVAVGVGADARCRADRSARAPRRLKICQPRAPMLSAAATSAT